VSTCDETTAATRKVTQDHSQQMPHRTEAAFSHIPFFYRFIYDEIGRLTDVMNKKQEELLSSRITASKPFQLES
jgi:hypothetical protein